jgi:hypothetical protein
MPVVLVTIDSDWSAPSATPRTACSAADGERAVSLSKQVLEYTGADSSLEHAFEHIGNVAAVVVPAFHADRSASSARVHQNRYMLRHPPKEHAWFTLEREDKLCWDKLFNV